MCATNVDLFCKFCTQFCPVESYLVLDRLIQSMGLQVPRSVWRFQAEDSGRFFRTSVCAAREGSDHLHCPPPPHHCSPDRLAEIFLRHQEQRNPSLQRNQPPLFAVHLVVASHPQIGLHPRQGGKSTSVRWLCIKAAPFEPSLRPTGATGRRHASSFYRAAEKNVVISLHIFYFHCSILPLSQT